MFKKISLLTIAAFASAAYADVVLDLRIVLTHGGSVKEVNKTVTVVENSSVELYRCEDGQLIGCVDNVSEKGATLHLQVNTCTGEVCAPFSNRVMLLEWNNTALYNVAHEDSILTVEVVATQVQAAN